MLKRSLVAAAVSVAVIGGSAAAVGAQDEVATPESSPVAASEAAAPSASLPNTGAGATESSNNDMLLLALLGVGGVAGTVGVVATKRSHR
ncbi:MAG: hypothetical protein WBA63_10975 [Thermomicrobiales bacterium]